MKCYVLSVYQIKYYGEEMKRNGFAKSLHVAEYLVEL